MDKYECYCCHKEVEKNKGVWIKATNSKDKLKDGTYPESRFVCNSCLSSNKKN